MARQRHSAAASNDRATPHAQRTSRTKRHTWQRAPDSLSHFRLKGRQASERVAQVKRTLGTHLVFRVRARVNDAVHVEVEIVDFKAARIGLRAVDGNSDTVNDARLFDSCRHSNFGITANKPSKERWHTHGCCIGLCYFVLAVRRREGVRLLSLLACFLSLSLSVFCLSLSLSRSHGYDGVLIRAQLTQLANFSISKPVAVVLFVSCVLAFSGASNRLQQHVVVVVLAFL